VELADLGADSYDGLELTLALEDGMGIQVPATESASFKTVGDVIALAERYAC
jgi:acyl carrier protein